MIRFLLIFCTVLYGCGHRGSVHSPTSPTGELGQRRALYMQLAPRNWDVSNHCDALLFVALQQVGLGEQGDVEQAESEPGKWNRLPGPDYAARCSSDISRDMYMGLFTWAWEFKRLDVLESVWDYGMGHGWQMGAERDPTLEHFDRTWFRPSTVALLAELIYRLGGANRPERLLLDVSPLSTEPGFVSHLSLLELHMRGEMHGYLTEKELDYLRTILTHMSTSPLANALYHKYTDGDQSEAIRLLLTVWPGDRLPTDRDWTEEWRTQRSDGDTGFQPGDSDEPHSGGDLLFVCRVILGRYNQ